MNSTTTQMRQINMTKSEIFKSAHAKARATAPSVGNYLIAFSIALKEVYASLKNALSVKEIASMLDRENCFSSFPASVKQVWFLANLMFKNGFQYFDVTDALRGGFSKSTASKLIQINLDMQG